MKSINLVAIFVSLLFSVHSFAHQDDARILLRKPLLLFDDGEAGKLVWLGDYAVLANFGSYFATDEFHSWRFGVGFDKGLIAFSNSAVWRFGLNLDTIADSENSIKFRIGQTHYEVFSAMEFKVDESVAYVGYRHRCRHAADKTDARIIMKTGPEIGFNGLHHAGRFDILWSASALYYLYGQNDDLGHQHRMNVSTSVQAELALGDGIDLFSSAGLSAFWITRGDSKYYDLFSPFLDTTFSFSPGASLGMNMRGKRGELKAYLAYSSVLDPGFRSHAKHTHMISLNGELWY